MNGEAHSFIARLATSDDDIKAAQHLRYKVFVEELGSNGVGVDHANMLEQDAFDPFFDHLMLFDMSLPGTPREQIVGVYRLMRSDQMPKIGRYYCEDEYDLTVLKQSGRKLLELGRSCLHPDYRGGMAMYHIWNALADYVRDHDIEVLFGAASFRGTDLSQLSNSLSHLHYNHLAPPELRVRAVESAFQPMNLLERADIDRMAAMRQIPSLIKAYLKLGGLVGDGAFIDHAFNTIDVCMIVDTSLINTKQRDLYVKDRG